MSKRPRSYRPEMTEVADLSPDIRGRRGPKVRNGVLSTLRNAVGSPKRLTKAYRNWGRRGRLILSKATNQRVVVKARFVRMKGDKGVKNLRVHLAYLERSGTGLERDKPTFFDSENEIGRSELSKRVGEWGDDPHHFRFIVSPEKASELNLQEYARNLMRGVEKALETKLNWFAVTHHNTDNPHIHITVRGVDADGQALFMDREFIKSGFRGLAEQEATRVLGQRLGKDRAAAFEKSLKESRFIGLDRELLEEAERSGGIVRLEGVPREAPERERFRRHRKLTRLYHLGSLGLAEQIKVGLWRVDLDLEPTLRLLAKRREITQEIGKSLIEQDRGLPLRIYEAGDEILEAVRGEVVQRGIADEMVDTPYLLVRGEDRALHYFPLGRYSEQRGFQPDIGSVVSIQTQISKGKIDEKLVEHAVKSGGVFDLDIVEKKFKRFLDPEVVEQILGRYEGRLQSLERLGVVESIGDGKWKVPLDLSKKVEEIQRTIRVKPNRFRVHSLSNLSLSEQVTAWGGTWLDQQIEARLSGKYDLPTDRYEDYINSRIGVLSQRGVSISPGYFEMLVEEEKRVAIAKEFPGRRYLVNNGSGPSDGRLINYLSLASGEYGVVATAQGVTVIPVQGHQDRWKPGEEVSFRKDKDGRLIMWQKLKTRSKEREQER